MPEKENLEGLIGQPEISVLVDVYGKFADNMAEYRIFEDEVATPLKEADLSESIKAGRRFSRDSHAALARTEQSEYQSHQARALLLPNVYLRASRGYETSEPSVVVDEETGELLPRSRHIRTDVTFTATQPLFDLPSFLDWRRRKVREQAREEGYRVSDGDTYVSMVNTYLTLVASRLQADVRRDFEAQLAKLLEYIEKRAGAGAASISDMSRVRARSQASRSLRMQQESAHLAAGTEFVRLTNLVPRRVRLPKLEDVGAEALPETFDEAVDAAMKANPEIAALKAELEAEKIDRRAAKSLFLPRFDAEYTDTYSDHAGGSSESQRDKRIMMVANWNLFRGGKDLYTDKERMARYKELQYRLDDRRRRVVQELSANYATLETTSVRIEAGYEELASIATAAEAMSKRMLAGNQSLLDLLTVYDRYYQVRSSLIDLHVLEMNTVAELIRLTRGAPSPPPGLPPEEDGPQKVTAVPGGHEWDDALDPGLAP
nr:TolC family protein [Desulfuromonadales bacterium]